MTGRIVYVPERPEGSHRCEPRRQLWPRMREGTIWECECGQRWVWKFGLNSKYLWARVNP